MYSYYSYLRGFANSNSDLFVASEQKPSDDMLYILQKPKKLPLQEVCSDHMNTFKIIVSTKINMYQREFRCKTSFFDEVWYCTQDPINNVCLKIMDLFLRRRNLPNQNKINEQDIKLEALLTENKQAFDFIFKKIQEIETLMHTNNHESNRLNPRSKHNFDYENEYTNYGDSSIKGEKQINIQGDYNNTYTSNGNSSAKGENQMNNQQFESYNGNPSAKGENQMNNQQFGSFDRNYFKNIYNNFKNKLRTN
ncbi:hypothetical protein ACTFIW_003325 [Dictyostelium discoideum]